MRHVQYRVVLWAGALQLMYMSAMLSCSYVYCILKLFRIDGPSSSHCVSTLLALHTDPEVELNLRRRPLMNHSIHMLVFRPRDASLRTMFHTISQCW